MLTVEKFTLCLSRPNHADALFVGVDTQDENQFYIIGNGGMGNINCAPIESFSTEIKYCAREMINQGKLYIQETEKPMRIGDGRNIFSYRLRLDEYLTESESSVQKMYFSSLFIRWQRTHQLSDMQAQEKLELTADEFQQFREDELTITNSLINKLAEVTGTSKQFWQNRWVQKKEVLRRNNEKI